VPRGWKDNRELAEWCNTQRKAYNGNEISPDRIMRLEQIGFVWEPFEVAWETMFIALATYKQTHGDCNVSKYSKDNLRLGQWCNNLRARYRNNTLSPERIKRLENLGFLWDPFSEKWEEMFAELVAYKKAHGDCNVPAVWKDNPSLGMWCYVQRRAYRINKLSPDHIKRLEQLGFVWELLEVAWEEMFADLTAYKQAHGDCNVPWEWKDNPKLAHWCSTQRERYNINKLSSDRTKRLEDLGFRFDKLRSVVRKSNIGDIRWNNRYRQLIAYKQTHGDCNVSKHSEDNHVLGTWCSTQRENYNHNKLSRDRVKRLAQLGFMWNRLEPVWEEMFADLTAYKQAHGHCNVPWEWKDNPKLARWCSTQRTRYKFNGLSPDRVKRLKELGFRFGVSEPKKK